MKATNLPIPLKFTGPDGQQYTTYTAKHYAAFERGMEARKAGKPDTACPYRSELAEFWLAGYSSPTHQPSCDAPSK